MTAFIQTVKFPMVVFLIGLSLASYAQAADRPNVLLVLTDNQSLYELSCHGHSQLETPNIDLFASQSIDFMNFHAQPFCSPSRAELLTGRYALRSGVHNTVGGVSILRAGEATLANYLNGAGYRTAIFGKWHLGITFPYHPSQRGFEQVFIHGGGGIGQMEDYFGNNHVDATWDHNGVMEKSEGFSTDVLFQQAASFIHSSKDSPFFCFISTPATHTPYQYEPKARRRLMERGVIASEADLKLFSMIENIDDNFGQLMEKLEQWNLKENTIVILATDQGVQDRGAREPRFSGKRKIHNVGYDEKHAVFCMMRYPPMVQSRQSQALAGMIDITPTVLDLCGIPGPSSMDGRSLRPLLNGEEDWKDDRKLIIQCPRSRYREKWKNGSVKTRQWRLVGGNELYDIAKDRSQLENVAAQFPDVVSALSDEYERFWASLPPASELLSRHPLGLLEAPEVRLVCMDWYRGGSPWHQLHLTRAKSNGVWPVDIERDGRYRFELRWYPRESPRPIGAITSSVRVGSTYVQKDMSPKADRAVMELNLKKGSYDLETAFQLPPESNQKESWGAYFVYVSYLGSK